MSMSDYDKLLVSNLIPDQQSPEYAFLVVKPHSARLGLDTCRQQIEDLVAKHLHRSGAILFRGFSVGGQDGFGQFVRWFVDDLLSYDYGSTPRTDLGKGVYTSTEYPEHQTITLHNEMAYASTWPMKIWFYAHQVSETGGETPLADSRQIYRSMPSDIRDRFERLGLKYVRNFQKGMDLTWQQTFQTEDPEKVEAFCDGAGIEYEWQGDKLKTIQYCQGVARHPPTDEMVWFNQAHLFHHTNLDPVYRQTMLQIYGGPEHMPRNVFYGDGSPIPDATLAKVREVIEGSKITFPWQQEDVLLVDNMLCAHGRNPFTGKRLVMVAMAEPQESDW